MSFFSPATAGVAAFAESAHKKNNSLLTNNVVYVNICVAWQPSAKLLSRLKRDEVTLYGRHVTGNVCIFGVIWRATELPKLQPSCRGTITTMGTVRSAVEMSDD